MWGAGSIALVATAGCNPFSTTTRVTQTVTAAPATAVDVLPTLVATTRLHVVRLSNAISADRALAGRLTPIRADRQAHLTALITELGRSSPAAAAAEKKKPTADAGVAVPRGGAAALLVAMRSDAASAQSVFTDALAQTSRYRAALFGSIVACLASHRVALA